MPIPSEEAFAIALEFACEDYQGLYELVWAFNGKFPEATDAGRLTAAQLAVTRLAREGLVSVLRTRWTSSEHEEIDTEAAVEILANPTCWRSPAESTDWSYYCFASTPAGDERYYGRRPGSDPPAG